MVLCSVDNGHVIEVAQTCATKQQKHSKKLANFTKKKNKTFQPIFHPNLYIYWVEQLNEAMSIHVRK
jgi:hypothetical protein